MHPTAILVHVSDIERASDWYSIAFPGAVQLSASAEHAVLQVGSISLEMVKSDSKVGSGKQGTVVYWHVESWLAAIERFEALGARLYRGPLIIEDNQMMCQFEDPFGNLIGIRGEVT